MKKILPLTLAFLLVFQSANSQLVPVIAGDKLVKDLIHDIEEVAHRLLADFAATGNFISGRIGNQLSVAAQDAANAFGAKLDKGFKDLDKQEQQFFTGVHMIMDDVDNSINKAAALEDKAAFDISELLGKTIFGAKIPFYVQSINNFSSLRNDTGYKLQIIGKGFGQSTSSKYKSSISSIILTDDTTSVPFVHNETRAGVTDLILDAAAINSHIRDNSVNKSIHLRVNVHVDCKEGLIPRWKAYDFSCEFTYFVYPNFIQLQVHYQLPAYDWVRTTQEVTYVYTTPDFHSDDKNPPEHPVDQIIATALPGQRFQDFTYINADGPGCAWTRQTGRPTAENGGRDLQVHLSAWGRPCVYRVKGDIYTYMVNGAIDQPDIQVNANYGENFTFNVPVGVNQFWIFGKTIDGRSIRILNNTSYERLILFGNSVQSNDGRENVYSYNLSLPFRQ